MKNNLVGFFYDGINFDIIKKKVIKNRVVISSISNMTLMACFKKNIDIILTKSRVL